MITAREARETCGKSQERMASEMGLALSTYRRKESGSARWYLDEIVKFCELTGVPFDQLDLHSNEEKEKR